MYYLIANPDKAPFVLNTCYNITQANWNVLKYCEENKIQYVNTLYEAKQYVENPDNDDENVFCVRTMSLRYRVYHVEFINAGRVCQQHTIETPMYDLYIVHHDDVSVNLI